MQHLSDNHKHEYEVAGIFACKNQQKTKNTHSQQQHKTNDYKTAITHTENF